MTEGNARHIHAIERGLEAFEAGEITIEGLQATVEGEMSALEGPSAATILPALRNFTNQLELYLYSLPLSKQSPMTFQAIATLRTHIEQYVRPA
jgi:hypothetical protein